MEVIVDGERNFQVQGNPDTVLSVVVAASDFLREKGRAIFRVEIDGESISAEHLMETLEKRSPDSVNRIVIASEDLHTLVSTCLDELDSAMPDLPRVCRNLAEVFQSGNPETGYEPFQQVAEIWRHVKVREAQVAHALDLDLESLQAGGVSFKILHDELNRRLGEAAEALEANDCVLLGDLLEYELAPRAEAEAAIVAELRARAAELSG
jgi:hypothetical protein